jgi:hypothetical protein
MRMTNPKRRQRRRKIMLLDLKTEEQTYMGNLVAWLEAKNQKESYNWDSENCLYGQYCDETGREFIAARLHTIWISV